jgi:hypothetical protein
MTLKAKQLKIKQLMNKLPKDGRISFGLNGRLMKGIREKKSEKKE